MTSLDKAFLGAMGLLMGFILIVLVRGDHTVPQITRFNHQSQMISSRGAQLVFSFNRDMDRESVQQGFQLTPSHTGKFSWIGRKMAFTPAIPFEYGMTYRVEVKSAMDRNGIDMPSYYAQFETEAPRFVFLNAERELHLWESNTTKALTPPELRILSYVIVSDGEHIFFSAVDTHALNQTTLTEDYHWSAFQQFYVLQLSTETITQLSEPAFFNFGFAVSANGQTRILYRVSQQDPSKTGWWVQRVPDLKWHFLSNVGDGAYVLTPNGDQLLAQQQSTFYLFSTKPGANLPPQLVGRFFQVYGFNPAGTQILFTQSSVQDTAKIFNSVVLLDQQGRRTTYLENQGLMANIQFSPTENRLYFAMAVDPDDYEMNEPYFLYSFDLTTETLAQLTSDPDWSDEFFSVSRDGKQLIFERFDAEQGNNFGPDLRKNIMGQAMTWDIMPTLWFYHTEHKKLTPLELQGVNPQWIP